MSARDEQLAREWFEKAERDLLTAETMLSVVQPPTDVVCFHCQQAAEKHLKGLLTWHGTPPTRTHDLGDLLWQRCTVEAVEVRSRPAHGPVRRRIWYSPTWPTSR